MSRTRRSACTMTALGYLWGSVVGTLQTFQSQPTYLRKSLRIIRRNASSFVPKRVLIVAKLTRYHFERLQEAGSNEEQFKKTLLKRGSDYEGMLADHYNTKKVESQVVQVLEKMNVEYKRVDRTNISRSNVEWADLVLPIGGDGTFLLAANLIFDNKTPIVGINSSPKYSKGYLMLPSYYTKRVPEIFELLKAGQYNVLVRSRIRTTLKGEEIWNPPYHMYEDRRLARIERFFSNEQHKPTDSNRLNERRLPWLALNEVCIGEVMAAKTSTLLMKADDEENFHRIKSSGIYVCTGTGSTSWHMTMHSISSQIVKEILHLADNKREITDVETDKICSEFNAKLSFNPEEQKLCYTVRDEIVINVWPAPKSFERYNFCKKLTIRSLCSDGGLVLDGGIAVPFNVGTTAEFEIDPEGALRNIVLPHCSSNTISMKEGITKTGEKEYCKDFVK